MHIQRDTEPTTAGTRAHPRGSYIVRAIACGLCVVAGATALAGCGGTASAKHVANSGQEVFAWGQNTDGQLGDGTTTDASTPVKINGLTEPVSVSAGGDYSLALLHDSTVRAWGSNVSGRLGNGTTTGPEKCGGAPCSRAPVPVAGLNGVTAISAGIEYGLALKGGAVWAWGANGNGQLGLGNHTTTATPTAIPALTSVSAIAAGWYHALALRSDGTVMAWGDNTLGQLGDGTTTSSDVPTQVPGLKDVVAIAAGEHTSFATLKNGQVLAWGADNTGQLGDGAPGSTQTCGAHGKCSTTPVAVQQPSGPRSLAAGENHALAITQNGAVVSWGLNSAGELGTGSANGPEQCPGPCSRIPVAAATPHSTQAVAGGRGFSLALQADGSVSAWGQNQQGELGNGTTGGPRPTPTPIAGLPPIAKISTQLNHSLALTAAPPSVTGISPTSGPTSGGTTVTITGTNLTGVSAVHFATAAATAITPVSDTTVTATSPAGTGQVDVTVTTPAGTSATSAADQFTYVAPPPPKAPTVITTAATNITTSSATLTGVVNPNGPNVTSCQFKYGTTSSQLTSPAPCKPLPGGGTNPVPVSGATSALQVNTTYYYKLLATGPGGTSEGQILSFTTSTSGPHQVTVPNVVGKSRTVGEALIRASGLTPEAIITRTAKKGTSVIFGQNPPPGTAVLAGSAVAIYLQEFCKQTEPECDTNNH